MKRRKLMPHQKKAQQFIHDRNGCAGLFLDPGTGKTLTATRYSEDLGSPNVLRICRPDDFLTWEDELITEGWGEDDILQIRSSNDARPKNPPPWTFVTYDLVKNNEIQGWLNDLTVHRRWFDLSILDESHQIKRWSADRTRAVINATAPIPRRLALTGTPITNEILDVFSQCMYIDGGRTFGRSEWGFKRKYYVHDRSGGGWYPRRGSKREVRKRLEHVAFHVDASDVLTFPDTFHHKIYCPMMGLQRRLTEQLLNDWEIGLGDDLIEINYVISQIAKLKQVASGFFYDASGKPHFLRSGKLKRLERMLDTYSELGQFKKVVIWCSQTAEIEMISRMLQRRGENHVKFYGSNKRLKTAARRTFRDSRKCRFFVGQVESGVGMNELVVAPCAVYFSNSRKVVARQQSMRRTKRKGSERHKKLVFYDLVSEGSIDRVILRSINQSIDIASEILKGLKQGRPLKSLVN